MCVCVCFVVYNVATDAHSALQLGRRGGGGLWPRPKQKATVVSPQIACSEYHSTTESNEEERGGSAVDGLWGKRMAFIKLLRGESAGSECMRLLRMKH